MIDAKIVMQLRALTGAGMMEAKGALEETGGDLDKAADLLRKKGVAKADKKAERETKEGLVFTYLHANGKLGVLVELYCETDFVAKTPDFIKAAEDIVSAMNPEGMWFADSDFKLNKSAEQTGATYSPWNVALMMRSLGYYLDTYSDWYGQVDPKAQDVLLQYAELSTKFWQLGADEPTQYRIFETGGYISDTGSPLEVATADGLIWALDYDDGSLDREYVKTVADEVFDKASHPWGGYDQNTYMTTKTHVMMGINGWRYMHYKLNQN